MKVLAVGDIHTKNWIIEAVESIVEEYDAVVFVGDYADEWGSEPIDTINTWKKLRSFSHSNPNVKLVQGNHDYIYTHKTPTSQGGYSMGTQFLLNLPDNKGLKEWLTNLPFFLRLDGVMYSHAGMTEDWYESRGYWRDDSPIWVRPSGGFNYAKYPQVFGHTPSQTCWEVNANVWCIDTFSTYPDGRPFGDGTVLEIIDGKKFNKIKLENKNDRSNNNSARF